MKEGVFVENNNKVTIACSTHKEFNLIRHDAILPVHAGRQISDEISKDNYLNSSSLDWLHKNTIGDDTGENISNKNRSYCELSALFWLWKNRKSDYMGLCHYRRYLALDVKFPQVKYGHSEHDNGCIKIKDLTKENFDKIGYDDNYFNCIKDYDAIFMKPITLPAQIKNNYHAMQLCPDYHVMEDVDLMISIIKQKYPQMEAAVNKYMFNSRKEYLYNCFIMKYDLFENFCSWLFDVLFECESKIDISNYSIRQARVIGLLAERLVGIWITWLNLQNKYKIKETPLCYFENTDIDNEIQPAFSENNIAIASNFNDGYAPVFDVFLHSAIEHFSDEYNYDILVLSGDISSRNKAILLETIKNKNNVKLRFINPEKYLEELNLEVLHKDVYTIDLYYRVIIPQLLNNYSKILVVDADMIATENLANLYNEDITDYLAAGVIDTVHQGLMKVVDPKVRKYTDTVLKLKNPYLYINTGVLLFNAEKYRNTYSLEYLKNFIKEKMNVVDIYEQDMLNMLLNDNLKFVEHKWNFYTITNNWVKACIENATASDYKAYINSYQKGGIIHYANIPKPWQDPNSDCAEYWWKYAKKSIHYEGFIYSNLKVHSNNPIKVGTVRYTNPFQKLFSVKNSRERSHKIITICGVKFKIKRKMLG